MIFRKDPIFIIAYARSGSTLLRLMVNSHSKIMVPPECGFIQWLYQSFSDWTASDAGDPRKADKYIEALSRSRKIDTWHLNFDAIRALIQEKKPTSYAELTELVLYHYASLHNDTADRWCDKNNYYIDHIPTLHEIYPNARFVYLVRDPLDVVSSQIYLAAKQFDSPYKPNFSSDNEELAKKWADSNSKAIQDFLDLNIEPLVVKYSSLVTKSEATLTTLCRFLGEAFESGMLNYYQSTGNEPPSFKAWKHGIDKPIYNSSIGKHLEVLDQHSIERIKKITYPTLEKALNIC